MLNIKMEANTRNYLVRLLENYKNSLQYADMLKTKKDMELEKIRVATARLMGKEPSIDLNKNTSPINFGLGADE